MSDIVERFCPDCAERLDPHHKVHCAPCEPFARIRELEAVLKPFAAEAKWWDADQNGGYIFHDHESSREIDDLNIGHFRRARQALGGGNG